ncbi:MAG: 50S ribosomal protein L11 methyltransferase [Bacteroidales bacterium]|jgi:ribosomal protein L11 methyltransferase|nr:50S ribosomal protein L11 methyltransferase [Bacteroidales bacterium]
MKYIEVNITLGQNDPFRDLLVDALGNEGPYDSFVETPTGLKAYVQESLFDEDWLKEQLADIEEMTSCSYTFENLPDKNWNEEWEKQHKPVLVEAANGKRVWVRAPFHEHRSDVDYEIEIEPKMSFGTAHHQTTYMMLSYLTELELAGQRVLDMGCGTAVLAILAKIRGAEYVEAIDIDEWAYNNAIENAQRNGVALNVRIGDASLLTDQQFDLIIANINRNILLNDMAAYAKVLAQGGTLLLSGFYESDVPVLQQHAEALGLQLQQQKVRQSWAALRLLKR